MFASLLAISSCIKDLIPGVHFLLPEVYALEIPLVRVFWWWALFLSVWKMFFISSSFLKDNFRVQSSRVNYFAPPCPIFSGFC